MQDVHLLLYLQQPVMPTYSSQSVMSTKLDVVENGLVPRLSVLKCEANAFTETEMPSHKDINSCKQASQQQNILRNMMFNCISTSSTGLNTCLFTRRTEVHFHIQVQLN